MSEDQRQTHLAQWKDGLKRAKSNI